MSTNTLITIIMLVIAGFIVLVNSPVASSKQAAYTPPAPTAGQNGKSFCEEYYDMVCTVDGRPIDHVHYREGRDK